MKNVEKILKKIDRPPSAFNFVRLIGQDTPSTAKEIVKFAKAFIPWSYRGAYAGIKARIEHQVDLATAKKCAGNIRNVGFAQNADLINTFFRFDEERRYSSLGTLGFDPGRFAIGRLLWVPVSPLTVVRERGKFNSVFVCGWNEVRSLNNLRRRMLMTIAEDAFLSLTDFRDQPAEFLFFPKAVVKDESSGAVEEIRTPQVWNRGDYALLKKGEIDEMVDTFIKAREVARVELLNWASENFGGREQERPDSAGAADMPDFFKP